MGIQMVIDATSGADLAQQLNDLTNGLKGRSTSPVDSGERVERPGNRSEQQSVVATDKGEDESGRQPDSGTHAGSDPVEPAKKSGGRKKKAEPESAPQAAPTLIDNKEILPELQQEKAASEDVQKKTAHNLALLKPKAGDPVTLPYCQALILNMAALKGLQPAFGVINSFGVESVQQLPPEKFQEFVNKMTLTMSM